jgi:3-hydroxybutyryl-CoA dehydrogenase
LHKLNIILAGHLLHSRAMSWELHHVAIIGGGMMGRSIATKVAQEGLNVCLKEISMERVEAGRAELEASLDHQIARFGLTGSEKKAILSRIRWVTQFDCAADCDLAIETVQEDFGLKRQILRELDRRMPPEHPIVINTSTLSITELAAQSSDPERILGMHFLYPVTTTRVVEVVRGQLTADEAFDRAVEFGRLLGKVPIKVFEMPGFVTTRVILPLVNEAMHVVMEGVAEPAEVDLALKLGYDFRTGPLEWADRVGLDRVFNWIQHLHQESGEPRFRPCPLLKRYVRAGLLGAKTGRGFFTYDANKRRLDRLPDDKPGLA